MPVEKTYQKYVLYFYCYTWTGLYFIGHCQTLENKMKDTFSKRNSLMPATASPKWVDALQQTVSGLVDDLFDLLSTAEAGDLNLSPYVWGFDYCAGILQSYQENSGCRPQEIKE